MNERINELFGQALDQAVPETWTMLTPAQLSKLKDKFAELIVRECMSLADLPNNTTGQWDHLSPSEVIAKYFGVKS